MPARCGCWRRRQDSPARSSSSRNPPRRSGAPSRWRTALTTRSWSPGPSTSSGTSASDGIRNDRSLTTAHPGRKADTYNGAGTRSCLPRFSMLVDVEDLILDLLPEHEPADDHGDQAEHREDETNRLLEVTRTVHRDADAIDGDANSEHSPSGGGKNPAHFQHVVIPRPHPDRLARSFPHVRARPEMAEGGSLHAMR